MDRRLARRLSFTLVLTGLLTMGARAAETQGGFVMTAGRDTIALERFERLGDRIQGAMLFKLAGLRFDHVVTLAADRTVLRFETQVRPANAALGTPPAQAAVLEWHGDSVWVDVKPGKPEHLGTEPGSIPYVNPSMMSLELLVRRAFSATPPLDSVPMFAVSGGRTGIARLKYPARDSVLLYLGVVEFRLRVSPDGSLLSGSVPAQNVAFERVADLPSSQLAEAPRDDSPPVGAPYTTEQVKVPTRGGFALAGTLSWPRVAGKQPCVLLITGSGPQDRDESLPIVRGYRPFRQIADTLARRGIAVLRLDDRGTGESGGRFTGSTSADFANDVEDALRWLKGLRDIDSTRIALLGHSEGGLIAPLVAERDRSLKALVLMAAPAWTGRRIMEYQNAYAARKRFGGAAYDSVMRLSMRAVDSLAHADPWTGFFAAYDPLVVARKLRRPPVLLLQGATDQQVTAAQAQELAQTLRVAGNPDVALVTLPATNHLFLPDASGDPAGYSALPSRELPANTLGFIADWLSIQFFPRVVVKHKVLTEREREKLEERERKEERERRKKR